MKIYTYEGKANISGDRIHQARTAQRLSQDALAAKLQVAGLGIGREAISRIETGLRCLTATPAALPTTTTPITATNRPAPPFSFAAAATSRYAKNKSRTPAAILFGRSTRRLTPSLTKSAALAPAR